MTAPTTKRTLHLPEGVPPLNMYYVYLTGGCNLACQHCWIAPTYQPNGGTGGHLDYNLFAQAIEEGLPLGLSAIKLTGGEPLLHPEFLRIVDLITEKGLGVSMESNGTLMTGPIARHLKESGMSHISISLDGATAATHDPFRGVKGSFERAVQGARYLVEAGIHPQIIMSLHVGNVDEMEALVLLAESLGAESVKFNLIQSSGRGEAMNRRGRTLDIQRLMELGKWVDTDLQKRTPIALHYSWPMAFYSIDRLLHSQTASCGLFGILGILSTGHLAMCGIGAQIEELCYGQLGRDSVFELWTSHPTLLELRETIPAQLEGVCRSCMFRDQCLAMCVANNYQLTHSMRSSFWFCEAANAAGLFPSSRLNSNRPTS